MMRTAVFLDRDGTIIEDRSYLSAPSDIVFEKGAVEGLRAMHMLGHALIVVSNQSGIARGYFTVADVLAVNRAISRMLAERGVQILAWYICPHGPNEGCTCRKPAPGLLDAAASDHGIDLTRSFVIGDKLSDLELGTAVGAKSILVRTGQGDQHAVAAAQSGYAVCADLAPASRLIRNWRGAVQEEATVTELAGTNGKANRSGKPGTGLWVSTQKQGRRK